MPVAVGLPRGPEPEGLPLSLPTVPRPSLKMCVSGLRGFWRPSLTSMPPVRYCSCTTWQIWRRACVAWRWRTSGSAFQLTVGSHNMWHSE